MTTASTQNTFDVPENPFNIRQAIERVGQDNEGLYLAPEQKNALLDYIAWNTAVALLVSFTPYNEGKLFGAYGDGTDFTAGGPGSDTMTGLRKLQTFIVRRGAQVSRPDAEYVLHLLPAGRWASNLFEWMSPTDAEVSYSPPEPVIDVLAMAAALAMITRPDGPAMLDRVRKHALAAAGAVHIF